MTSSSLVLVRRLVTVVLAGLAGISACRTPPSAAARPIAEAARPAVRDSVWYISARARTVGDRAGRDTRRLSESLYFGLAIFARPEALDAVSGAVDPVLVDSVMMTAERFTTALQQRVQSNDAPYEFASLYVHGYGTSLHEAWEYTATASARARSAAPWIAFCWPSNGAGVTWPRMSDLYARAYRDDSASARASRPAFARAVAALVAVLPPSQLMIVAHSLGAQLVTDVFADSAALPEVRGRNPLRAIVLLAPDVGRSKFADELLPAIAPRSARTLLYVSANDRALRVAQRIHGTPRAGLRSDTPIVSAHLETVDITDGMTADGWFQRTFGNHHTIRRASATIFDIVHVVGAMHTAQCRLLLGTATRDSSAVWHLTPTAPPAPALAATCARYPAGASP